jgi:UDP-glucose 4-epimerase
MKFFITGVAGFIGSNLADKLLANGHLVVGYDNLSTGKKEYLTNAMKNENFKFIEADVLKHFDNLQNSMKDCDAVFHLSANADLRHGLENPMKDLLQNTMATSAVLEAMRYNKIRKIIFSSTGSVYGNTKKFPTPENVSMPLQTSLYASSKLSCEGLIEAYCYGYGFQSWIFRFASVLGERYKHGFAYDFYHSLKQDSTKLNILGDGTVKKSYIYVQDCLEGILTGFTHSNESINIFNLGTDEKISVKKCASYVAKLMKLKPEFVFENKKEGWVGDQDIFLDTTKIKSLGWKPKLSIIEAIQKTVEYLETTNG